MDHRVVFVIISTEGNVAEAGNYFFLCLFLRKRFFRLCVAILCLFLFFPLGIMNESVERLFYFNAILNLVDEGFCRLKRGDVVSGNNQRGIP